MKLEDYTTDTFPLRVADVRIEPYEQGQLLLTVADIQWIDLVDEIVTSDDDFIDCFLAKIAERRKRK